MKNKKLYFATFILDILLILLLTVSGWNVFASIFLVEILMWLVRLIWISPPLLLFILRRLGHMIPIILSVVAIGFFLIQLAPGDIFSMMAMNPDIKQETLERFRRAFGLDKPWYVQFFKYIWNALHGDFGYSELFKAPVFTLVSQRAMNTLLLAILSFILAWGFSIPAGIICATNQYKWKDQLLSFFAFAGMSLPNFFLAFLVIYFVSVTGNWLPIGGMYSINIDEMNAIGRFFDLVKHLIIPVSVLAVAVTAQLTRIMRANMLEILGQQYVTTARSKGLHERVVVYRHALRNAINPMITIFGFQLGSLLGGAALVETVLAWPGLGKLILAALLAQDLYLVVGSLIYGVAFLVIGNLVADILLAIVDPRVRLS